jgi:hypothetical protein
MKRLLLTALIAFSSPALAQIESIDMSRMGLSQKSSSSPVTPHVSKLVEREGIWYIPFTPTPYTGLLKEYYPNGRIKEKGAYKNGKGIGKHEVFYENGMLLGSGYFFGDNKQQGKWEFFDPYGELIRTEIYNKGERIKCEGTGCSALNDGLNAFADGMTSGFMEGITSGIFGALGF